MRVLSLIILLGLSWQVVNAQQPTVKKPETFEERLGYAYGVEVANSLKSRQVPIDIDQFLAAFAAHSEGQRLKMSKHQMTTVFEEYEKIREDSATGPDRENLAAGKAFLAEKAKQANITQTESGLLYEIIQPGSGPKPTTTSTVAVKYTGSLIDGTVFDTSTRQKTGIAEFRVDRVIRGWQEGLQLMPVGSRYRFYIPQQLAYQKNQIGKFIKPYSALVFEVELVAIK